jgi:hypothetical protein
MAFLQGGAFFERSGGSRHPSTAASVCECQLPCWFLTSLLSNQSNIHHIISSILERYAGAVDNLYNLAYATCVLVLLPRTIIYNLRGILSC